jgi:hypothetical protein
VSGAFYTEANRLVFEDAVWCYGLTDHTAIPSVAYVRIMQPSSLYRHYLYRILLWCISSNVATICADPRIMVYLNPAPR